MGFPQLFDHDQYECNDIDGYDFEDDIFTNNNTRVDEKSGVKQANWLNQARGDDFGADNVADVTLHQYNIWYFLCM